MNNVRTFTSTKTIKHMKLTKEQLKNFAAEINKDWDDNHSAYVLSENDSTIPTLVIAYKGLSTVSLRVDGTVHGDDIMTINQLNYMLNR